MKDLESFFREKINKINNNNNINNNVNETIFLPTFSVTPSKIFINKKRKIKAAEEEDYTLYNNNPINGLGVELPFLNKITLNNNVLNDRNINMGNNNDLILEEEENNNIDKKKFGRKKKGSLEKGIHNKFSGDNLFRKVKRIVLNSLFSLINKIIVDNYKNDKGFNKKKSILQKINQKQITNADVQFNKEFMKKTLKDIFSVNISLRCKRYEKNHNKKLIQQLLDQNDQVKQMLFRKIFDLTFLECLNHFRGTKVIKELNELETFDEIGKSFEDDEDYFSSVKYYIDNYEKIMENKKIRKKRKSESEKKNHYIDSIN